MTRINYVENGIYTLCTDDVESISKNLKSALDSASSFSCPSWFSQRSYVMSFDNKVKDFIDEFDECDDNLKYADREYEDVTETMTQDVKALTTTVLKERERMIV